MLDELIFCFNSLNGPNMQVLKSSSLILDSSIFYLQILQTIYYPNQPHLSFFQHQMVKRKVERRFKISQLQSSKTTINQPHSTNITNPTTNSTRRVKGISYSQLPQYTSNHHREENRS